VINGQDFSTYFLFLSFSMTGFYSLEYMEESDSFRAEGKMEGGGWWTESLQGALHLALGTHVCASGLKSTYPFRMESVSSSVRQSGNY